MRALAATLLALVALAAPAQAATVEPGEVAVYLTIAARHWGVQIDCVRVHEDPAQRGLERADVGLPDWSNVGTTGVAPIRPACDMWINPRKWARARLAKRCDAVVHGYGHMLGKLHTADNTIMDPLRLREVPECRRPAKGVSL